MRHLASLGVVLFSASLCPAADKAQKPATIPDLIGQLSSNDFHDRQHAAKQLGDLGLAARGAVPALAKALHDAYPEVRKSAAKALGQIGSPAVQVLVEALQSRDAGIRKMAAQALAQAGPDAKEAVPELMDALQDKTSDVRMAAIDALGEMGEEGREAAPELARLFYDPNVRLRERVRAALTSIGPASVEPLSEALSEQDKIEVRLDAIQMIALFGPAAKKALPALRKALTDPDYRIRAAAASALGKMELDGADAVPDLLAALKDKKLAVQSEAVTALMLLTSAGVPDLLPKVREADRKGKWVAPVSMAQRAAKPANDLAGLVKALRDKDPQVRTKAALVLAALGPKAEPALPLLTRALEDEDPEVRLTVAMVIARLERSKAEVVVRAQRVIRDGQTQMSQMSINQAALQLHPALADPVVQTRSRQVVMLYILISMLTPNSMNTAADKMLDAMGPESVPALVDGINFVANYQIGFC